MELVIYTDESDKSGAYYSNFYGGVLVRSTDVDAIEERLHQCRYQQNLNREIKWQKVTSNYLGCYIAMMDAFFDEVAADRAKVRIMFTSNQHVPTGLSQEQIKNSYHLLYYQFFKHVFGLQFVESDDPIGVRLNIDQMPTTREETAQFKSYLEALNRNPQLQRAGIKFDRQQIAEVSSHDHIILQCLDVVLGAMCFRLNNKHQLKPPGKKRRGKRTVAKEKLYRHILKRIRHIYPNFNIGISTGKQGDVANFWNHPYRHWLLIPKDHEIDVSKAKP